MTRTALAACIVITCAAGSCLAQNMKVSRAAWDGLSPQERAEIQRAHFVEVKESGTYGVVVDNQGVNESTPGTQGGAALGGAFAEAAYIDRALKPGNNYSAVNQLAVGVLGAIVGSAADQKPVQQFHFRYAVKTDTGDIKMLDSIQGTAFRQPAGLCVSIPDMQQLSQGVCTHTSADLRRLYLAVAQAREVPAVDAAPQPAPVSIPPFAEAARQPTGQPVACKLGNLSPVNTTAEKCKAIGGAVQ